MVAEIHYKKRKKIPLLAVTEQSSGICREICFHSSPDYGVRVQYSKCYAMVCNQNNFDII
jgi:hypothetical protein